MFCIFLTVSFNPSFQFVVSDQVKRVIGSAELKLSIVATLQYVSSPSPISAHHRRRQNMQTIWIRWTFNCSNFFCQTVFSFFQWNIKWKLSQTGKDPRVLPANRTHILVSWENAFVDCDDSDVKEVEVNIRTRKGGFENIRTGVDFSQMEAYLERNPCFQHQIKVVLEPRNPSEPTRSSNLAPYNEMEPKVRKVKYYVRVWPVCF